MGSISRAGRITIANLSKLAEFANHNKKLLTVVVSWALIIAVIRTMMAVYQLSPTEVADMFAYTLGNTWYGVLLFILLYIARPLALIPSTLTNLLAGMIYGFPLGALIVMVSYLLSITITYHFSRWLTPTEPQFEGQTARLVAFMRRNPFEAVMVTQLMYLSSDLVSSLAGILHIPFRYLFMGVLIGSFVSNSLAVYIGSSIQGSIANGEITIQPEIVLISVLIFLMSIGVSAFLRRRHQDVFVQTDNQ